MKNVFWPHHKHISSKISTEGCAPLLTKSISVVSPHARYAPHPFIVKTSGTCNGEPRIAGTRLSVRIIADLYWQGESVENLALMYDIDQWEVFKALEYAISHRAEIEGLIQQNERA